MEQKQINDRVDDVVDNAGQPAALVSRVLINFVIPLPTAFYTHKPSKQSTINTISINKYRTSI